MSVIEELTDNILLFEPQKNIFNELIKNIKNSPNIIAENFALGSENKKERMYKEHMNSGQSSSILEPMLHTIQYPGIIFDDYEDIEVKTLDSYFTNKTTKYNLILLDVQGYELEVLKGAINTLTHIDYILTEVNEKELYENCAQLDQLDLFLKDFIRVETTMTQHGWGDAFYIKKELI
jgi:FkbM family methyltransferase